MNTLFNEIKARLATLGGRGIGSPTFVLNSNVIREIRRILTLPLTTTLTPGSSITQTANAAALTITKSGTGAGTVFSISNAGIGHSVLIANSNGGRCLSCDSTGVSNTEPAIKVNNYTATYGLTIALPGSGADTKGLFIDKTNTNAQVAAFIDNDGTGYGLYIKQDGASTGLYINKASGAGYGCSITSAGTDAALLLTSTNNAGRALAVVGGQRVKRTAPATDAFPYTALLNDYIIAVTDTSVARTINLPAAASAMAGAVFHIKDESGAANVNNITIDADSTELIDGAATKVISAAYGSVTLYCTGTAWMSI